MANTSGKRTDYRRIEGSELRPGPQTEFLRPADPHEKLEVTIALRRRPDGAPMPTFEHFARRKKEEHRRPSPEAFEAKYGAHPAEIEQVVKFVQRQGLTVESTHASRRSVVVSGTVAQMNDAFGVSMGVYRHEYVLGRTRKKQEEIYRGIDGFVHLPPDLTDVVIGVFGLDNRNITKRGAAGDPPNTTTLTVPELTRLYDIPNHSATGQTIAILSGGGYQDSDLLAYYDGLPASYRTAHPMPVVTPIPATATNGFPDGETTQDICIAFTSGAGANISVYFTSFGQSGWYGSLHRMIHPDPGDVPCSVISTSFYMANGDDTATLMAEGVSLSFLNAVHLALEDAAINNVTFCVCSGDFGVNMSAYFGVDDGIQHVTYPASDPWALAVGGTTVGNVSGNSFDEYVWNDPSGGSLWGTTGGGISDYFRSLPSYQDGVGVPQSLVDNHIGRGVPDVSANASYNSGISGIFVNGMPDIGNGTSASTPFWAGFIAVLNNALGYDLGFVNPQLYALGSSIFRDIDPPPGPLDNGNGGVPGYRAGIGWDAATGWGSPNGKRLLAGLAHQPIVTTAIAAAGDFGDACTGAFRDEMLTINNSGFGLLTILGITSSSPDFLTPSVSAYPILINEGESTDVVIRFEPLTPGFHSATITIASNDPAGPHQITVDGNAPGPRLVSIIADNGNFADACAGSFTDEALILSNSGHCTLSVAAILSSSVEFIVPGVSAYPFTIAPGVSIPIPIRFQPAAPGLYNGILTVISDNPAGPHEVAVLGFAPTGKLAVTGSTCFGGVRACCPAERTISICNVGDCKLHVTSVAFKRPSHHWRLVNNPFPATLHPGSFLNVVIRYKADEKCPRACELVIESDDPADPVKCLDVMAYTIWEKCGCNKECCEDCGCDESEC